MPAAKARALLQRALQSGHFDVDAATVLQRAPGCNCGGTSEKQNQRVNLNCDVVLAVLSAGLRRTH